MKKTAILSITLLIILSCKEKQAEGNLDAKASLENKIATFTPAYAELSIKEGGHWRGREYIDGHFKNVNSLEVPSEHTDHSWFIRYEGPGWENSKIGYRLYLDWRNAIDLFGKKVDTLVLPHVGQDGFASYHEAAPWGQDILKAGKSMGIGSYGRVVADTIAHFQSVKKTIATVENSKTNSTINISYTGWKTGNDNINLHSQLTIYPHDRFTKAELTTSKAILGICTGIVKFPKIPLIKKEGSKWAYIATYGTQTLVNDTDKLGMAVFYNLSEVEAQNEGKDDHLVIFKPTTKKLSYYFLGAWEQELNGIKNQKDFIQDLDKKLEVLEKTNVLR